MSSSFSLQNQLQALEAKNLYRRRRVVGEWRTGSEGTVAVVDGIERIVFCSNDYLGFAHHPRVTESFQKAAARYGVGSGASHLVTGHSHEHHALEEALAEFTGRERALLFSAGYMANLGVVSALLGRGDVVLEDRLNHASLLDAGLLSGARFVRYTHGDAAAVETRLAGNDTNAMDKPLRHSRPRLRGGGRRLGSPSSDSSGRALIVTDGVFSMDGDIAPVAAVADVAQRHGAWLMVDDAHGLGVLGTRGRGTLEEFGLDSKQVPILMGTLGKALGTFGAFVAGDEDLIELLIQKARTYIYTTALPPTVAAATRLSLELIDSESWRRERLLTNVERFRHAMREAGLPLAESRTPIQPIILGDAERALAASEALWARGFWVTAIRPPTVPEATARLRITLSAAHTEEQIDRFVESLAEVVHLLPKESPSTTPLRPKGQAGKKL